MTSPKKPGLAFWATVVSVVVIGLPATYVASFGPVCWWFAKKELPDTGTVRIRCVPSIYWPIGYSAIDGPRFVRDLANWYATLGTDDQLYLSHPSGGRATVFIK
jgi:hypothetical protein